ncbi:hypothetical protein SELMODRAFT_431830 [Selaginella moellendorffii]|uniref:Uncharacterized protein n=1 Tax=Selaginella moellendorffii TaxID=88036 RepID=D8TDY2_SELML|nr:hypothetical protein SELMODRAFT_431830 [Selaginella moellendorffii]
MTSALTSCSTATSELLAASPLLKKKVCTHPHVKIVGELNWKMEKGQGDSWGFKTCTRLGLLEPGPFLQEITYATTLSARRSQCGKIHKAVPLIIVVEEIILILHLQPCSSPSLPHRKLLPHLDQLTLEAAKQVQVLRNNNGIHLSRVPVSKSVKVQWTMWCFRSQRNDNLMKATKPSSSLFGDQLSSPPLKR